MAQIATPYPCLDWAVGAALGLLFGISGILLNHRAVMKIPAAQMEQS